MQVALPQGSPQVLLWDVDGTLAETEQRGHRLAFNRAMADSGLPWQWDEPTYRGLLAVAGGRERLAAFLTRAEGSAPDPRRLDELVQRKQAHYRCLVESGELTLRPGVGRLMAAAAAAGLRQAIVTTSGRSSLEVLQEHLLGDLAGCLSFSICGEDVDRKKPDPQAYRLAVERLGSPADRALAIEDSVNGLRAARGAGLACLVTLGLDSVGEPPGLFAGATAVVEGLGDPDHPCRVRHGPPCPEGLVTLSWLEQLVPSP